MSHHLNSRNLIHHMSSRHLIHHFLNSRILILHRSELLSLDPASELRSLDPAPVLRSLDPTPPVLPPLDPPPELPRLHPPPPELPPLHPPPEFPPLDSPLPELCCRQYLGKDMRRPARKTAALTFVSTWCRNTKRRHAGSSYGARQPADVAVTLNGLCINRTRRNYRENVIAIESEARDSLNV